MSIQFQTSAEAQVSALARVMEFITRAVCFVTPLNKGNEKGALDGLYLKSQGAR